MREKKLIIFIDSGDTLVDESTEYRKEGSEVVERALLIPGAKQALLALKEASCTEGKRLCAGNGGGRADGVL